MIRCQCFSDVEWLEHAEKCGSICSKDDDVDQECLEDVDHHLDGADYGGAEGFGKEEPPEWSKHYKRSSEGKNSCANIGRRVSRKSGSIVIAIVHVAKCNESCDFSYYHEEGGGKIEDRPE